MIIPYLSNVIRINLSPVFFTYAMHNIIIAKNELSLTLFLGVLPFVKHYINLIHNAEGND